MGTLGRSTRNGKKAAPRRAERGERTHPAAATLAVALREHKETLEQQAATAEILRAISSSSTDPQPVFEAIVEHAHRLCSAVFSILYRYDGNVMTVVADRVNAKASRMLRTLYPAAPRRDHIVGRAILDAKVIHSADVPNDPRFPGNRNAFMKAMPFRAGLEVPLLRNGAAVGVIAVGRLEPKRFSKREISLLQTFADQALIAMENVRLFNETKEALEHQKASADILRIVAESVENASPVFDAITKAGTRLIPGCRVGLLLARDAQLHHASHSGISAQQSSEVARQFPVPLDRSTVAGTAIFDRRVIHIPDIEQPGLPYGRSTELLRLAGDRAMICVPLLRGDTAIGALSLRRPDPGPFTDKQIELAKTFADQAVIAIQNAKMFREIQDRNAELKQALDFQGASGEILASISSSVTDTKPVFDAIAENTRRLLDTKLVAVSLLREGHLELVAAAGDENYLAQIRGAYPWQLEGDDGALARRAVRDGQVVHVCPIHADEDAPAKVKRVAKASGYDSILMVPMLREGVAIGLIVTARQLAIPFDQKQIAVIKAFADQAVIAIENARLFNETKESLEQQTATAEILKVISSSPTATQPVFDAIVQSAARLFPPCNALILMREGDHLQRKARAGPRVSQIDQDRLAKLYPLPVDANRSMAARAMLERRVIEIPDTEAPGLPEIAAPIGRAAGYRAVTVVPLIREGEGIGCIALSVPEPGFKLTDKQLALVRTFADQAVIAIENVRLFNETKEALEQQTATSEVLGVISASPTDLGPVFGAILKSATELCDAHLGMLSLYDGEHYRTVAHRGANEEFAKYVMERGAYKPSGVLESATVERRAMHVHDVRQAAGYLTGKPQSVKFVELAGARTALAVPLLKEGKVIGAILIYRPEVRPFTDKQIALVTMFANQAVIAIENVRLFNETKEALEQQTGTAEILKVISSSPTDTQPVFDIIANRAVKLCDAEISVVSRFDGELIHLVASHGVNEQATEIMVRIFPMRPGDETVMARTVRNGALVHVADVLADPLYSAKDVAAAAQYRSSLGVPMMRAGEVIGAIFVGRAKADLFSDKQVALMQTFADQAVIAIENVRLFNETKDSLEQQTATSEILKVISRSPTDVQPVFEAIVESAARLFEPCNATITMREGEQLRRKARAGPRQPVDLDELNKAHPIFLTGNYGSARAIQERRIIEVLDTEAAGIRAGRLANFRSLIVVPLMRDEEAIGTLALTHEQPGYKLAENQLALLQTFADQAVIAIENVRLFNELQTRNRALTEALEQQTATGEILKTISSATSDVQPVFDTIVRNAARLCDAAYGILFTYDGKLMDIGAQSIYGPESEILGMLRRHYPMPASRETPSAHAIFERTTINIADIHETSYSDAVKERARAQGWRSGLTLPMMRDDTPIGALSVVRREPGVFSDSYVALLKTFAAQAVIAVENVRLFNQINEALRLQTSTADVLKTISRSTFDLDKVLQALLDNAARLSGAERGAMLRPDAQGNYVPTVICNYPPDSPLIARMHEHPIRPGRDSINGRVLLEKRPIHVPDVLADPEYGRQDLVGLGRFRTVLSVPMLRDGEAIGLITLNKGEKLDPFTDKQLELVTTFADQAVIAIENVRLFKEIEEKSAQLEVANKHKSDFLANMSHELRTPLNAIIGFSEALMERMFGELNEKQADYLKDIHESGKHLLSLINDILDLSKIEAGRMELDLSSFHLPTTISNAMTLIRERAQRHGIELEQEVDSRLGDFKADERKVKQILLNLLSNAVKFTPEGGRVEVSAKLDTDHVEIAVKDTGVGISLEDQNSLFEEFRQVGKDPTRRAEGTGLGLALTKRFVELHGGAIRVDSAQGKGSIFTFSLPVRQ